MSIFYDSIVSLMIQTILPILRGKPVRKNPNQFFVDINIQFREFLFRRDICQKIATYIYIFYSFYLQQFNQNIPRFSIISVEF